MSELPPGGEVSVLQAGSGVSVCASLIELRSVVSKVKDQTMALQEINSGVRMCTRAKCESGDNIRSVIEHETT